MAHFIDDPVDVVSAVPDFENLGLLISSDDQIYLVGVSNPALGIDNPILAFKSLSKAKEFISSTPVCKGCFYSISIISFL